MGNAVIDLRIKYAGMENDVFSRRARRLTRFKRGEIRMVKKYFAKRLRRAGHVALLRETVRSED
jgi:hypothetical protein